MARYDDGYSKYDDGISKYNVLDMVGVASIVFTLNGAVTGSGNITGISSISFVLSAPPSGAQFIDGTTSISFALSGNINGLGVIKGIGPVVFTTKAKLVRSPYGPPNIVSGIIYGVDSGVGNIIYETSSALTPNIIYETGTE